VRTGILEEKVDNVVACVDVLVEVAPLEVLPLPSPLFPFPFPRFTNRLLSSHLFCLFTLEATSGYTVAHAGDSDVIFVGWNMASRSCRLRIALPDRIGASTGVDWKCDTVRMKKKSVTVI
jgi:hypothetical protein